MNHGGHRRGAGRKPGEPTKTLRIPASMVRAVQGLQRIAKGIGTEVDLAEIAVAINSSSTEYRGIVGVGDMNAGLSELEARIRALVYSEERDALEVQLDDLRKRIQFARYKDDRV